MKYLFGLFILVAIQLNAQELKTYQTKEIPFHEIYITNGYSKNQRVWKENSRVKRFLVLLNDQPQFHIDLEDTYLPQRVRWRRHFLIDEGDTVAFEIVEVYEGDKYKDTAISDLSIQGAH